MEALGLIPYMTVIRGKATTSTNVNTAAKILAYEGDWVTFDNTSDVFTIDEDEGTDANVHGLQIIGGDHIAYTLDVTVHANVCAAAPIKGQTRD